ncbi:MAG: flagellar motor switch protein FliG [Oscillospiraceae bacterium]|nr:flagellar motor switch protein FliG [Oscillospiraceae bacterium]
MADKEGGKARSRDKDKDKDKDKTPEKAPAKPAPPKPEVKLTSAQRAAAVIVALGAEKASKLYKHMDPTEVEQLTLEVAKLGYLDSETTEEALTEFHKMCLTNKAVTEGGLEYARAVLEKAYGAQAADDMLSKVTKTLKNREFSFMSKADVKSLFSALNSERAQTIALVLSYMDADKAAGVIAQLDVDRQIQVVEGMANIDSVSPSAVKIIEAEMSQKFSNVISSAQVKVGGIDYVADVMNNLDRASEKSIFDGLMERDQELADEIRKRMFVFEDIVTMDDRSVQRFVRDCDPRDLVLALKAANAEVGNKLFANMSSRMAQTIKDDLEITTNVRMKDVEAAQQRIVDIIRTLEERNEIIILKGGKDDIIA